MVSIADQPASVPPATSTRSMPSGTGTAYHRFWRTKADRCSCHSVTSRACSACVASSERCWSAPSRSTRSRSAPIRRRSTRSPRQIARPHSPAVSRQAAMAGEATTAGSQPATAPSGEHEGEHDRGGGREAQRPRDELLLPPLRREPVRRQPRRPRRRRRRPARRRPRVGGGGRVLPPEVQRCVRPGGHSASRGAAWGPARRGSRAGTSTPDAMSRGRGQFAARTNSAGRSASSVRAGITGLGRQVRRGRGGDGGAGVPGIA